MDVCRRQVRKEAFQLIVTEDRFRYGISLGIWSQKITLRSFEAMGTMIADRHSGKHSSPERTLATKSQWQEFQS
jgi:hypothetical protein